MKVGDLVRHTARLEWGVGVLVAVDATRYTINFEHRDQAILTIEAASKWLESVDPVTVASDSALRDPDRWSELELAPEHRHKKSGGKAKVSCAHCHKPLNNGLYSKDRKLKSCPQCSAEDGTQHVFYPCPDGFGRSEERVTDGNPDGDQSYCYKCRGREMNEKNVSCAAVTQ